MKQESVLERLRVYRIHTQPLLDYYASKGLLEVIDSPTSDIGLFHTLSYCALHTHYHTFII